MTRDPRSVNWRLPSIVALFAAGALLFGIASSAASAGTSVNVGGGSAAPGGPITSPVSVSLAANDSVNGFDVTVGFSPSVVTASSVTLAGGWIQGGNLKTTIDNAGGSVRVQAFQLGTGCSSGPCALFSINWTAGPGGSTQAAVTAQQLSGSNGGAAGLILNVSSSAGALSVTGGSATNAPATATSTSVPATATSAPPTATSTQPAPTATQTNTPAGAATSSPTQAASATATTPSTQSPAPTATSVTPAAQPTANAVVVSPTSTSDSGTPGSSAPAAPPPAANGPSSAPPAAAPAQSAPQAPVSNGAVNNSDPNAPRFIPLPPRTGNTGRTEERAPGVRELGLAFMALAGTLALWSLAAPRLQRKSAAASAAPNDEIDRYLRDAERRGRQ